MQCRVALQISHLFDREFAPEGRSQVLRSGRFGVGVLAAFLLGPRIEVHTRHANASKEEAVYFTASLEDDDIELLRKPKDTVGTSIRLELVKSTEKLLGTPGRWDWYTLDFPRVQRLVHCEALKQQYHLPTPDQEVGPAGSLNRISPAGFAACFWSFSPSGLLVVNGIGVSRGSFVWSDGHVPWQTPALSVFDPDGRLPLNLRRDGVEGDRLPEPLEALLLRDMTIEICAFLLTHAREGISRQLGPWLSPGILAGLWEGRGGVSLRYPWHVHAAGVRRGLLLPDGLALEPGTLRELDAVFWIDRSDWNWDEIRDSLGLPIEEGLVVRPSARRAGRKILREDMEGREIAVEQGATSLDLLLQQVDSERLIEGRCAEFFLAPSDPPRATSPIVEAWRDVMGDEAIVPYDPAERRKKLGHAFRKIRDRIELWLRPEGWRKEWVNALTMREPPQRRRGRPVGW